ncbi:leucine-rich repeat serine/threonine-protein kinase 1 isoform X1 [Brienomyrus brachyistius]|uniref:leucine-rich repeat serine/threonine-protein kinase 1 isoform X1 n=2 Tax=Brienomyrus brachyistius TaxID=42636 RepID=UPI0020B3D151|nr:leucine-rich repeat serine/threonine-protein kinase 1 isoform X1 [Brienomyrus brachyistius]XP_048886813.1 leucine-rich repeat serine/threonine-protein kinase 1 isoform X1 [Brienomyrus brachyistius]XP_048886814.1 leucine-rich repeat serine/threonine-protein kinase 1 isoform X1 [Brienomyrus brachyistius]XP_048886815.1 leucine-rich repeat serine/threonine-protein kinase 1 isoform X1 [Brienomyrus brachyistius]XP_048886816.1 leucine-rich repeat serine/threonine-protein kinase 1 isoform X1 [Brieno
MYWSVGDTVKDMEEQDGATGMGGKQSFLSHSPTLENIQAAYAAGDNGKAQELIRISCSESTGGRLEKHDLLCVAAKHGDRESVHYLVKEAKVPVPREPLEDSPAILAAHFGHHLVVRELLEALPVPCVQRDLLSWMLTTACEQGHLEVVKLLVYGYQADPEGCAIRSNEFAVITGLPLYAAARAGHEEISSFLLQNGAGISSYTLMDHPGFARQLLRGRFMEPSDAEAGGGAQDALSIRWCGLKLPWLDLDWFMDLSSRITQLDLSSNSLSSLPSVVPWGLIHLQTLDLSSNQLKELPDTRSSQEIICSQLREVNLSQNELSSLPIGLLHLTRLQKLIAAKNQLTSLFEIPNGTNWIGLRKLEELDVSDNSLMVLPTSILHCLKSLVSLNVCRNKLSQFPEPWACPLKCCKASSNALEFLPDTISMFWKTLKDVDFSENTLRELLPHIFELEGLVSLKLCGNQLSSLPAADSWKCSQLKNLDLSRNQLGKYRSDTGTKTRKLPFFTTWSRRDPEPVSPIEFPIILRDSLEVLLLSDNQLECVPQSVCTLRNLSELYLSNNPGIRELPAELGLLSNLWQLDIEQLSISNIPAEVRSEGPAAVLAFLRAHLRKAERCKMLKMIVVGPPRQGKTTLLEALQTGRPGQFLTQECSVRTSTWELERPSGVKATMDSVEFNVWDVGGPASMSTVNQCFFTDKALYVVIWNLALGEEAVASLQSWLLNIEASAPNSAVIVVGTHLDLIDTKFRIERIATLRAYILALCRSPSGARASGYPDVTCKHLHEVSCKTSEGLDGLKRLIFQVACTMKDVSTSSSGHKLVGRLIPRSYLLLQDAVIAEQQRRDAEDEVQYLTDLELEKIIEQNPTSDIKDYEDLQTAIGFLIETGTLLHFPDTSHGLCKLYFLDAKWLSECLERIINIKSSRSVARNGVIRAEDLRMLLVGTGFTEQTEEQYFQFLAKFEIALPVANNSYLLPHLLPPKPAMDIHCFRQQTTNTIQRLFKMSFVPAGFWERFIARMLISLTEMDLQTFENKRNTKNLRNRNSVIYSFAGNQQRNRCSTFRVRRSQTIYWKEGLLVTFDGGYLSVESSDLNWKQKKSGGIKIICQSDIRDFSAMAFITDHVNSLIEQWFPALTASENDGSLLMEQYAPCSVCVPAARAGPQEARSGAVHLFNMADCVLAAVDKEHVVCPNHPQQPVLLQELVPELFMTDFPARLFLENQQLECSGEEQDILGQGGSGTVIYRAKYRGELVAIKRFHFKKCRQLSLAYRTDTMMKHLQSVDASRTFSEFRQEASMLHTLQHPCIVALLGISIHPLCFTLQLAPLGSLNSVLEERAKGVRYMPLGHMLTFKAAYQIAAGLAYLHKKSIIFCDLKSDNILVWSLEVCQPVNVKLSDYGISRQSFHEGALGVEGTPGYQAPEIKPGIVYDEKVDMFSYGMVLYELLSGRRPALGQHQLQIAKKLSKGVRPVLGSLEEVQFHCLQSLMVECWDTKPEKRPLAAPLLRQMQEPSFPCFKYLLSCENHDQLFLPGQQGHSAVFWDGEKDERNYTVVNLDNGQTEVRRMPCPGMRLSCQLKTENTLWTATEDHVIYIYSLKEMCPLGYPQRQLACPAMVTCLFLVPAKKEALPLVFVGMADGLLAVYMLCDDMPLDGETYLCSHTVNRSQFQLEDTDPRQRPYPVLSMALVRGDSEVWYTNGPGLLVVDRLSLQAVRRLEPYRVPSRIVSLAASSACWGEEAVWCLDDHTNTLLMYHAATYRPCATYACGDASPLRDTFGVTWPSGTACSPPSSPQQDGPEQGHSSAEVRILYEENAGTQILCHQDSLTDYCSVSSSACSLEHPCRMEHSGSWAMSSLASSSVPASPEVEEPDGLRDGIPACPSHTVIAEPALEGHTPPHLQALAVLAVKGTVWIPRRGGDMIVIELQQQGVLHQGRVIAMLHAPGPTQFGTLVGAAVVAKDTVVCGFRNETAQWCLAVWRSWGAREMEVFYQSYEELGRLETMKKRR